jgi:hypothetical protein
MDVLLFTDAKFQMPFMLSKDEAIPTKQRWNDWLSSLQNPFSLLPFFEQKRRSALREMRKGRKMLHDASSFISHHSSSLFTNSKKQTEKITFYRIRALIEHTFHHP